ncbi:unnamed protein product [Parascedosporium putredinis]|uniref:PCI domain-containing protein n=1 Tax=Parascedosporium putredinis TaxID=1442378 RepID=A0A9P1M8G6_9PEZI|nr:unnamed protein product [Parascedosporium putredinis]CAI7992624.1 unnamed protein product [Parascedosporium putredinis]
MSYDAIPDFLAEQREEAPEELQGLILEFENFWERKLWHQLTEALLQFFRDPRSEPQRLALYKTFVLKFADKINQLKLVELALAASTQCPSLQEKLHFLEALVRNVDNENTQDALVYASVAVARVKLELNDRDGARKDLLTCEKVLDSFASVETVVHAAFYDANATYFQMIADFAAYYRNTLLYLASLVSESIYNFGELLLHPILDVLVRSKEYPWLRELLFAFNRGDLDGFDRLSNHVEGNELLHQHSASLRQKIHLAALTEAIFQRPPHDRSISFKDIAISTKFRLLRGTIDQVDQMAHITWVQPKVLDMKQIGNMRLRLLEWDASVNELGHYIENTGKDVWAA